MLYASSGSIQRLYRIDPEPIGIGTFGVVRRAVHLENSQMCAVKTVSKSFISGDARNMTEAMADQARMLKREVDLLQAMEHPNIVKLKDVCEDDDHIYILTELCQGGELIDFIVRQGHWMEREIRSAMRQLLGAVKYMHEQKVVHRDLKPANFLMMTSKPFDRNVMKIIDFGLAVKESVERMLRSPAGTPYFMAPQVFKHIGYDRSCDLWSCGVILFLLCCGYPPFVGKTSKDVTAAIVRGNYTIRQDDWASISDEAKDLVRQFLKLKVGERITAQDALSQRWTQGLVVVSEDRLPQRVVDDLRTFGGSTALARAHPLVNAAADRHGAGSTDSFGRMVGTLLDWLPASCTCMNDYATQCGHERQVEYSVVASSTYEDKVSERVVLPVDRLVLEQADFR